MKTHAKLGKRHSKRERRIVTFVTATCRRCHLEMRLLAFATFLLAGPAVSHAQQIQVLHSFLTPKQGAGPSSALAEVKPGLFYGTTYNGGLVQGADGVGCGVLFSLTKTGSYQDLFDFPIVGSCFPTGSLVQGIEGSVYGVEGGSSYSPDSYPSIFVSDLRGDVATVTLSTKGGYAFDAIPGPDGSVYATLIDLEGCFGGSLCTAGVDVYSFSTTSGLIHVGSINGSAVTALAVGDDGLLRGAVLTPKGVQLYEINHSALVPVDIFRLPIVFAFSNFDGFAEGSDGRLYYVTDAAIFSTALDGSDFRFVRVFTSDSGDNCRLPIADLTNLVLASDGSLYGGCSSDSNVSSGTIYRISSTGTYSHVLDFPPTGNGETFLFPATVRLATQGLDGRLYGEVDSTGTDTGLVYALDLKLPPPIPTGLVFTPTTGAPGQEITIYGQHLLGATQVTIGDTQAVFRAVGDSYILATVPAGAVSGVPITVTGPNGVGSSKEDFTAL